jgi:hypothetical protein
MEYVRRDVSTWSDMDVDGTGRFVVNAMPTKVPVHILASVKAAIGILFSGGIFEHVRSAL